ncbi:DUF6087 family protein [Streptomyces echinatus]|uniref:DUF6087 family protein n=1 Tax=Streptomyces echinatus TaxID=67293 RepID=UPI001CEC8466
MLSLPGSLSPAWQPVTTVDNYAAAQRLLSVHPTWLPEPDRMPPTRSPMAPGTGRHRKP